MRFIKMILNSTLLFSVLTAFSSCNGQNQKPSESKTEQKISVNIGDTVSDLGKNIDCIYQDKNDNYWFASNGEGLYRYDGKMLTHITDKDGLLSNFVLKVEEDINGDLWFSTRDGVCSFNGVSFTNYTDKIKNAPSGKLNYTKGGLFFGHLNGLCFYDGKSFTSFAIHPNTYSPSPSDMNRPYSVYSTLTDNSGNVWFGTQEKGVCRYDGNTFTFFTEHGLDKAAVRTLFQDKAGNIWAGNNGAGLFKFNGKGFINFTDEKGLANRDFLKKLPGKEGTLARPWTMNKDENGNLWIGTIDAGVWKYDGTNLTNYTTKDGLTGNAIWTIYRDKKGELWFVTDGEAICKYNGNTFTKYEFH
jgi:streptogramin lyase